MMKRLAILSLLTVLIANLLTTESRSAIDAARFVSLEGRFSISLPDRFKQQSRLTIATPSGNAYGPCTSGRPNNGPLVLAMLTHLNLSVTLKLSNNCSSEPPRASQA